MTFDLFRKEVCALLNRSEESLVMNGIDLVLNSTNRGRATAQRLLDFERLRKNVTLTVDLTTGVDLTTAVLTGTTTMAEINRIKGAAMVLNGSSLFPLEYLTYAQYSARLSRRLSYDPQARMLQGTQFWSDPSVPVIYKQNNQLSFWPTNANVFGSGGPFTVQLDCIVRDPDWTGSAFANVVLGGPTATGADFGPFIMDGNPSLHSYFAIMSQVGTYNGLPFFHSTTGTGMWMHYTHLWPNPMTPTGKESRWILSNAMENLDFCWFSPTGVNGLNSLLWLPNGFGVTDGTYLGLASGQTISDTSQDTSFWLDECQEWLQLYVLQYLQTHFIKSTDKWQVTQAMVNQAWASIVSWNESIGDSETSYDLD